MTPKSHCSSNNCSQIIKGGMHLSKIDFSKGGFTDISNNIGKFNTSRVQNQQKNELVNVF